MDVRVKFGDSRLNSGRIIRFLLAEPGRTDPNFTANQLNIFGALATTMTMASAAQKW